MALRLLREYDSDSKSESDNEDDNIIAEAKIAIASNEPTTNVKSATCNKIDAFNELTDEEKAERLDALTRNNRDGDGDNPSQKNVSDSNLTMQQSAKNDNFESEEDRDKSSSSDSEADFDSDWESLDDSDSDIIDTNNPKKIFDKAAKPFLRVKGELVLDDLPPIEDLKISVPHQECELIGTIYNIVDKQVIVQSLPNKPSLDLDTVLFLDNGAKVLGQVFDVFGQITEPFYSVRFNSADHIKNHNLTVGSQIYYAPKTDYTNFIVLSELMRLKGSDASWKHDLEIPSEMIDYSDDEKEREAKRECQRRKTNSNNGAQSDAQKRHKPTEYEERMNRKNNMKTAEWNNKKKQQQQQQQQSQKPWLQQPFNPFGRQNNAYRPSMETTPDINWSTNPNIRFGTFNQMPRNWTWGPMNYNNQSAPHAFGTPPPPVHGRSSFMRPPRFSVSPMYRHFPPPMDHQNPFFSVDGYLPYAPPPPGFPHPPCAPNTSNANPPMASTSAASSSSNLPMAANFSSPPPFTSSQSQARPSSSPWLTYSSSDPPGT